MYWSKVYLPKMNFNSEIQFYNQLLSTTLFFLISLLMKSSLYCNKKSPFELCFIIVNNKSRISINNIPKN